MYCALLSNLSLSYLGRFEWVVAGEMDAEEEDAALERTVGRTHDGSLPMEHIVANGAGGTLRRWIPA